MFLVESIKNNMDVNYKKFSQYAIGVLFFLFPILSIIVKDWVSLTFLILTLGGITYGLKAWKILTPEEKKIFIGFSVFCGLAALTFLNTEDTREWFRYFEKYTSFLFVIFSYLFLRQLNFNFTRYFISGAIVAPFVWLGYYYYNVTPGGERHVWAYYAIFSGNFAALIASFSMVYLLTLANTHKKKAVSIMVFVLATAVAVLSQTRSAWLCYPVLLLVLIFMYRKTITSKQWIIGSILITTTSFILFFNLPEIVKERIEVGVMEYNHFQAGKPIEAVTTDNSVGVRLQMWQDSIKMFNDSPIFGVGINNFEKQTKQLISQGKTGLHTQIYGHAHNVFFNTLALMGLVGFLGFVFFIIWLPSMFFLKAWRNAHSAELKCYSLAGIILITSFIVFGLTEAWLTRNPLVRTYLIIMVLLMSSIMSSNKRKQKE